ncbi:hypothetical protein DL96DRAFT_1466886 [Flagelloscypha sp. PMI_526]|nr:hypothetical protein DL96DRAFT_1466886 [Flagelloscypha sp. PMI_526]
MSFAGYDDAWGTPSSSNGDIVKEALKKEQVLKDIAAAQEDLKVMLAKVQNTQKEVDKLSSGNETLQMYIDNLTMKLTTRR